MPLERTPERSKRVAIGEFILAIVLVVVAGCDGYLVRIHRRSGSLCSFAASCVGAGQSGAQWPRRR